MAPAGNSICLTLLAALLAASLLSRGSALGVDRTTRKAGEAESTNEIVIPEWKLDLVAQNGNDWWTKFGNVGAMVQSALWGVGLPDITASPAQDHQRCPVLKLPQNFYAVSTRSGWAGLSGKWNTDNGVNLANWHLSYLSMGFSRNIAKMGVGIHMASTGQVAIRTRLFSDEEMLTLYDWKEAQNTNAAATGITNDTDALQTEANYNLAIFDCVGTLLYVVKQMTELPRAGIKLYSRDGSLVSQSLVGQPVLRYQFVDPISGYLIATAEAPGINASIKSIDIPRGAMIGGVLPFGFHFEAGGYKNSSALMESEYRWVLASAVQALAIYEAQIAAGTDWGPFTFVEAFWFISAVLTISAVVAVIFGTYRCVYPGGYHSAKDYYGRIAENPWLAVPPRPPHRGALADEAKQRLYAQEMGAGYCYSYGAST